MGYHDDMTDESWYHEKEIMVSRIWYHGVANVGRIGYHGVTNWLSVYH